LIDRKTKIGVNVSQGRSNQIAIFQLAISGRLRMTTSRTAAYYVVTGPTSSFVELMQVQLSE